MANGKKMSQKEQREFRAWVEARVAEPLRLALAEIEKAKKSIGEPDGAIKAAAIMGVVGRLAQRAAMGWGPCMTARTDVMYCWSVPPPPWKSRGGP